MAQKRSRFRNPFSNKNQNHRIRREFQRGLKVESLEERRVLASVLGFGTGALVGNDLTDIGDNGVETAYSPPNLAGFDGEFFSNLKPYFGPYEGAFNVFDNLVEGSHNKALWGFPVTPDYLQPMIVGADFSTTHGPTVLKSFTISSANDTPGRDPTLWSIEGSNDTTTGLDGTWTTIYNHSVPGSDWAGRLQVNRYSPADGDAFLTSQAFTAFRMVTEATGIWTIGSTPNNRDIFQLGEIEFFGSPAVNTTTTVSLSGADLLIEDTDGADTNDNLTLSISGSNLVINDPVNAIATSIPGATGDGTNTVTVPLSAFSGDVIVNTFAGDDVVNVSALGNSLPAGLIVDGGADFDTLNFNGNVSLASGAALTGVADTIDVNSDLSTSGTGAVSLTADRNIVLNSGASLTTTDGAITLVANQGATPTSGSFSGILLDNADIQSVTGPILLEGRGGTAGSVQVGVLFENSSEIKSLGTSQATAATITIKGTGGSTSTGQFNDGITIGGAGSVFSSHSGDVTLIGQGGTGSRGSHSGIETNNGSITVVDGDISMVGTGGIGGGFNNAIELRKFDILSTGSGDINIQGTAVLGARGILAGWFGSNPSVSIHAAGMGNISLDGTGAGAPGIDLGYRAQAEIVATGGNIVLNGASDSTDAVYIHNDSTLTTSSGAIDVTTDRNIRLDSGASLTTTDGAITLRANQGATAASGNFDGIAANNADISSITGDILLEGRGGDTGSNNRGVELQSARVTSDRGDIAFTGQGGNSPSGSVNIGVLLGNSVVESTGTNKADAGTITLTGAGGSGVLYNQGVELYSSRVSSVAGDIQFDGQGSLSTGQTGSFTLGVQIFVNSVVESTGSGDHAASITINGTGGAAVARNFGVWLRSASRVTSVDGDIALTGQAGDGSFTNIGTVISDFGSLVQSTGINKADAGTITLTGTGGSGSSNNHGVEVRRARVSSVAGNIELNGMGGGNGTGGNSLGAVVWDGGRVESTGSIPAGAADITINGTGGNGTSNNLGAAVFVNGSVATNAGDISITGHGGSGSLDNNGVMVDANGSIASSGGGNINLDGTANSGISQGVLVRSSSVSSAGGNIGVTGIGSGGAASVEATGIDAGTGAVTLTATTGFMTHAESGTDVIGSNVTINGEVSPRGSADTGQTIFDGDVTFSSGDVYTADLNGLTVESEHDQLQLIGAGHTIELGDSTLNVNLTFTPSPGDEFVIIENVDPSSSVSGTFAGLPDGAVLAVGGTFFHIYYNAGTDENDVVLIVNQPPTADANGPYYVPEGGSVDLDGTGSSDPDGDSLTYAWDLDNDGSYDDASGPTPSFSAVGRDGLESQVIGLKVFDNSGAFSTTTATVEITNVAPMITSFGTDSAGCGGAAEHETVTATLEFDDPGTPDVHTVVIDWGDGTVDTLTVPVGDRVFQPTHSYTTGGVFDVTVSVADDDEPTVLSESSASVVVTGVGVVGDTLYIVGTDQADHVTVNQTGKGVIKVHADFLPDSGGPRNVDPADYPDGISSIVMLLCDGDDHGTISSGIELNSLIDGGDGDDHLNGGDGQNLILGGGGADHINGGGLNDILIGGQGEDRLVGNAGRDFMYGGDLDVQPDGVYSPAHTDALLELLDDWDGDPTGAAAILSASLLDDEEEDKLTGSSSEDTVMLDLLDIWTDLNSNGNGKNK